MLRRGAVVCVGTPVAAFAAAQQPAPAEPALYGDLVYEIRREQQVGLARRAPADGGSRHRAPEAGPGAAA